MMRQYISRASFNPGAKFIILYINPNVLTTIAAQHDRAYRLFRLMYDRFNAANVVFLHAIDTDVYKIFVTDPYENSDDCGIKNETINSNASSII